MKKTEILVKSGKLRHGGNPCLRWQFSNVEAKKDVNCNYSPKRENGNRKIDGPVATIMSIAGWFPFEEEPELEEPCLLFI